MLISLIMVVIKAFAITNGRYCCCRHYSRMLTLLTSLRWAAVILCYHRLSRFSLMPSLLMMCFALVVIHGGCHGCHHFSRLLSSSLTLLTLSPQSSSHALSLVSASVLGIRIVTLILRFSILSSQSRSSSGRRCPDVLAKCMPVLRHSACCCHRTKRVYDVFSHLCLGFPLLPFPATIPCIVVFSKPLCRVT